MRVPRIALVFVMALLSMSLLLASHLYGQTSSVTIYFFGDAECAACKRSSIYVDEAIKGFNGTAVIHEFEVRYNDTNRQTFLRFCSAFSLQDVQLPIAFVGRICLQGEDDIRGRLVNVLDDYIGGEKEYEDTWAYVQRTRGTYEITISLPIVLVAAAVDSINPCAIGVAVFLLSFALMRGSPRRMLKVGIVYIIAVYVTYLAIGLGLMSVVRFSGIGYWFSKFAGIVAILAGLMDVYSWVKGDGFCVDIPQRFRRTVIDTVSKASLPATFLVGALVASIELPCTGAVYLSITSMLAKQQSSWLALFYLVIYNFVFVLPLMAIVTAIHLGLPWVEVEKAKERRRGFLNLISGILLTLLGTLMLTEII